MAVEWVDTHQGIVSAIATVVIAVATGVTAWLTHGLVRENRFLRKVGNSPMVIAYLLSDTKNPIVINFVLRNVGRGPARNVTFDFDLEEKYYDKISTRPMNRSDRSPISFLPQDESVFMFFGISYHLLKDSGIPCFLAKIKWQNLDGIEYKSEYKIDIRQFLDIEARIIDKSYEEISLSLKNISEYIERYVTTKERSNSKESEIE